MADPAKKESLIAALREARGQVAGKIGELRHDFSISERFRRSVRNHPTAWHAGAAVVGLILSRIPSMGKKVVVPQPVYFGGDAKKAGKAAFALGALKILIDLGKPFASMWLKDRLKHGPAPRRSSYAREEEHEFSEI